MSQEKLQQIHNGSMQILEKTGIRFHSEKALELLRKNGIRTEGDIAFFTEEQIMSFVKKAPSSFKLYARNPIYDMEFGGDTVNYMCSGGPSMIVNQKGEVRNAGVADMGNFVKLYETNPLFRMSATVVQACDTSVPEYSTLLNHYAVFLLSDKCSINFPSCEKYTEALMRMVMAEFGDADSLRAKPRIILNVNTLTPLQIADITEDMLVFAKYGQPVIVTPAAMAGTTSPVTLAGTIAMANAETLAGIALVQMANPGNPVVYGTQSSTADMRTGAITSGAPENALCQKYGAQMSKFYGLPCRGGGGTSDAKVLNAQAGFETMMNLMLCVQNGVNLIYHSAGILDGFALMSYEKLVADFEIINYIERYNRDIEINETTLPFELIDEVGHGGEYITSEHTLEEFRNEMFIPNVSVRGACAHPATQFEENVENRLQKLFESYEKPKRDAAVAQNLRAILKEIGIDEAVLAQFEAL